MFKERLRFLLGLFSATAERFSEVEGPRLGAAFAYYATFSIFPAILLAVTVFGFVLGDDAPARDRLLDAFSTPGSRDILEKTLMTMQESRSARGLSAVVALFTLLFSASGATVELDNALNRIWCVPPRKAKGIVGTLRTFLHERLSGFAIVVGIGAARRAPRRSARARPPRTRRGCLRAGAPAPRRAGSRSRGNGLERRWS
jgi:membrane protein